MPTDQFLGRLGCERTDDATWHIRGIFLDKSPTQLACTFPQSGICIAKNGVPSVLREEQGSADRYFSCMTHWQDVANILFS
jgi:hypothetical protein